MQTAWICKIINKSLNYILINYYEKEKPASALEISYTNLCKILADNLGNFYVRNSYIKYKPVDTKRIQKEGITVSHTPIEPTVLNNLLGKIKDDTVSI